MRSKKHTGGHDNNERWLLTYADMITLLVAFFIMLYAMSITDVTKFQELALSVRSGFDGNNKMQAVKLDPGSGIAMSNALISPQHITDQDLHFNKTTYTASTQHKDKPNASPKPTDADQQKAEEAGNALATTAHSHGSKTTLQASKADERNMEDVRQAINAVARKHGIQSLLQVSEDEKGLTIRILTDKLLFAKGDARLRPQSYWLLNVISKAVSPMANDILVEGHTDDLPIHTAQYPSNWELSTSRATNVLRYMVEKDHIAANRMSCAGYAYTRPIVPNTSDTNRSRNRRVDIVIVRTADVSSDE
jgi:chemotaxis protein MotB